MDEIFDKIMCRETQLKDLFDLLGDGDEPLPNSIFISGCMATGKSLCVESVLQYLGFKHVVVNCIEYYSPRILFENILSVFDKDDEEIKCDTMSDVINFFNRLYNEQYEKEPIVIVFDKAERLRKLDNSIMPAFLRLREMCNINICTVFVTHLVYENFFFERGVREPIKLYFPNYNKEELSDIIFLYHKSFIDYIYLNYDISKEIRSKLEKPELLRNFLSSFLITFHRPCRDLIELMHMAHINFSKYCEPIIHKEICANDLNGLWKRISPILRENLELLYLRISNSKSTKPSMRIENCDKTELAENNNEHTLKDELTSRKMLAENFELPYYAKFLLIAAYLASYNPPKVDKRLFMKNHGKQRKKLQQVKAKKKINEKLNTQLGPKVFTLDRLLAIFNAILEGNIALTRNLLLQIATLVELKLLAGSKEIDLDTAKYKCIVSYEFISTMAQTVDFNIRKYLYDFI